MQGAQKRIYIGTVASCFGGLPTPLSLWDDNFEIALFNKLFEKIRAHDFDMGTFLGEGRESLQTIGDITRRTALSLDHLRHGRFPQAFRAIGAERVPKVTLRRTRTTRSGTPARYRPNNALIYSRGVSHKDLFIPSDIWLEYTYGITPLLNDAKSSAEALNVIMNQRVPKTRVRTTKRTTNTETTGPMRVKAHTTDDVSMIALFSGTLSTPTLLNLDNPLAVLWEVTPLSFVADWFMPIGAYLHAVGDSNNIKFDKVIRSHKMKTESHFQGFGSYTIPGDLGFPSGSGAYYKALDFRRTILSQSQVPVHIRRSFPKVKPLFKVESWKHAVSGLALLTQMFK
jgi:hypothetical protein